MQVSSWISLELNSHAQRVPLAAPFQRISMSLVCLTCLASDRPGGGVFATKIRTAGLLGDAVSLITAMYGSKDEVLLQQGFASKPHVVQLCCHFHFLALVHLCSAISCLCVAAARAAS